MNVYIVTEYEWYAKKITKINSVWSNLKDAEIQAKIIENKFCDIEVFPIEDMRDFNNDSKV